MLRTTLNASLASLLLATALPSHAQLAPGTDVAAPTVTDGVNTLVLKDQVARAYGRLATGATPADSAKAFIDANSMDLWGVDPADLRPYGPFETGEHVVPIMPDREAGGFKFTGLYYSQHFDGVPVYKANLIVLVRNMDGFPAVLASSTLWDAQAAKAQIAGRNLKQLPPERTWTRNALSQFRAKPTVSPAQYVVWAGIDRVRAEPRLAVLFTAEGGGHWDPDNHQRIEFVVDADTGAILHQESKIYHAVSGRVTGIATQGNSADTCAAEVAQGLPYVEVRTGNTVAYADFDGNYSIPAGAAGATYTTRLAGRWFTSYNNSNPTLSLSTAANDGAAWSPVFNEGNLVETDRSQVNAYLHANIIRDLIVAASPQFPTVNNQPSSFQVNSNIASTCNAYYTASTINFYLAGGGCANTAFGTVVHHEYGHNAVEKAGSGQGEYGEGMGDVCGLLVSDEPRTGIGFQTCANGIRTAANNCQFSATGCSSCGSAIHACGQLISGCVWDLRNLLLAAYPSTYRTVLADLAVNSMLLHGAVTTINSDITIDFLQLDDDNANLADGTPNYQYINQAFSQHGLPGPAIQLLNFQYPDGLPQSVAPNGTTPIRVQISASGTTPNPWTARIYSRDGSAGNWEITSLIPLGGDLFTVNIPGGGCLQSKQYYVACNTYTGVVVTDPPGAPLSFHSAPVATSLEVVASNEFEGATTGWTVGGTGDTATNGLWVAADPFRTAYGNGNTCQPEDDRSPVGARAFITGNTAASGTTNALRTQADVDGGTTTLTSPAFDLSASPASRISYWRWYAGWQSSTAASTGDSLVVQVSNDSGASWTTVETVNTNAGAWVERSFAVADFVAPTATVRVRFRATDAGTDSTVEAGIDDFRVEMFVCDNSNPADLDGDGGVSGADLAILLANWGNPGQGDLDGDGLVSGSDLGILLASWG
jgi:hypothetical protein